MKYNSLGINWPKRRYQFFYFRVWLAIETSDILWCSMHMCIEVLPELTLLVPKYYISSYPESFPHISHSYSNFHNIILIQFCRSLMMVDITFRNHSPFQLCPLQTCEIQIKILHLGHCQFPSDLFKSNKQNKDFDPVPKM